MCASDLSNAIEAMGYLDKLGDNLPGGRGCVYLETGATLYLPSRTAFTAQCLQGPHPTLVAGSSCLYSLAYPHFLLGELFIE